MISHKITNFFLTLSNFEILNLVKIIINKKIVYLCFLDFPNFKLEFYVKIISLVKIKILKVYIKIKKTNIFEIVSVLIAMYTSKVILNL